MLLKVTAAKFPHRCGPVDQSIMMVSPRSSKTLTLWRASFEKTEKQLVVLSISSGDIGTELKFTLESGQPVKVASKEDKEIHSTIAN
jgi:hypothetical protein